MKQETNREKTRNTKTKHNKHKNKTQKNQFSFNPKKKFNAMIFYQKYQNKNEESKAYGKWYARVAHTGEVGLEQLASKMQENCTVKRADILAVLSELAPTMSELLQEGKKIRIPYLGLFKVMINTSGADSPEKFQIRKNLKRCYVLFRAESHVDNPSSHSTTQEMVRGMSFCESDDYNRPESEAEPEMPNP